MPIYRITLPDGSSAEVSAPAGTAQADLIAAAFPDFNQQSIGDTYKAIGDARARANRSIPGQVGNFLKTIPGGAIHAVESALLGAATPLPEGAEDAVRGAIQSGADWLDTPFEPTRGYEDAIGTQLGEGLGSLAPFLAASILSGGSVPVAMTAGAGIGGAMGVGEASERARTAGATEEERGLASLLGLPIGMSEALPFGIAGRVLRMDKLPLLSKLLRENAGDDVATDALSRIRRIATSAGEEAAQETASNLAQNLVQKGIYDPELDVFTGTGQSAGIGGGVGGLAQALFELAIPRTRGADAPPNTGVEELADLPEPGPRLLPPPSAQVTPEGQVAIGSAQLAELERQRQSVPPADPRLVQQRTQADQRSIDRADNAERMEAGDLFPEILKQAPRQAPPSPTTITPEILQRLGVAKNTKEYSVLDGADLADVNSAPTTFAALQSLHVRTKNEQVKRNIGKLLALPQFQALSTAAPEQQPMIGPRGGIVGGQRRSQQKPASEPATGPVSNGRGTSDTASTAELEVPEQGAIQPEQRGAEPVVADSGADSNVRAGEPVAGPEPTGEPTAPESGELGRPVRPVAGPEAATADREETLEFVQNEEPVAPAPKPKAVKQPKPVAPAPAVQPAVEAAAQNEPTAITETPTEDRPTVAPVPAPATKAAPEQTQRKPKQPRRQPEPEVDTEIDEDTPDYDTDEEFLDDVVDYEEDPDVAAAEEEITAQKAKAQKAMAEQIRNVLRGETAGIDVEAEAARMVDRINQLRSGNLETPLRKREPLKKVALEDTTKDSQAEETARALDKARAGKGEVAREDIRPEEDYEAIDRELRRERRRERREAYEATPEGKRTKAMREQALADARDEVIDAQIEAESWGNSEDPGVLYDPDSIWEAPQSLHNFHKAKLTKAEDNAAVTSLVETNVDQQPLRGDARARAAKRYFEAFRGQGTFNPADGLYLLAYDLAFDSKRFTSSDTEIPAINKMLSGTGGENATRARQWVRANLSPEANELLDRLVEQQVTYSSSVLRSLNMAEWAAEVNKTAVYKEQLNDGFFNKREADKPMPLLAAVEAVTALEQPIHPAAVKALEAGELITALKVLAAVSTGRVRNLVDKLIRNVTDTKVMYVDELIELEDGRKGVAAYDPETNTIRLVRGRVDTHILLHEVMHAATYKTLLGRGLEARMVKRLFEIVKPKLGTAYGANSVNEFVAEAMTNPEFQGVLRSIEVEDGSAWRTFVRHVTNVVRRLMGLPVKATNTVMDVVDALVDRLMSPSSSTANVGTLAYSSSNPKEAMGWFDKWFQNRGEWTQEKLDQADELITQRGFGGVRRALLGALPLNALADLALRNNRLPSARVLDDLVRESTADRKNRNEKIGVNIRDLEAWMRKAGKEKVAMFNDVVYSSTIAGIDPSRKDGATYYKGAQAAEYAALKKKYDALGKDGQAVYKQLKDAYAKLYEEVVSGLEARIDQSGLNEETKTKLRSEIKKNFREHGKKDPYFPLTRGGKYKLAYKVQGAKAGEEIDYMESFATARERERAMKELRANSQVVPDSIAPFEAINKTMYNNAPPGTFVNRVLKIVQANSGAATDAATQKIAKREEELIMEAFIDVLPETSFAQGFRKRKDTPGYDVDALAALRTRGYSLSSQISKMKYSPRYEDVREALDSERKAIGTGPVVDLHNELTRRIEFAQDPYVEDWVKAGASMGFMMTLGFNVSSAIINMSQIPLVMVPYFSGEYGLGNTTKAFNNATAKYMNSTSGKANGIGAFKRKAGRYTPLDGASSIITNAAPNIGNYFEFGPDGKLRLIEGADPEMGKYLEFVEELINTSQLSQTIIYDTLEVDESSTPRARFNAASGFIFHHAERMVRQVGLMAAYDLEVARMSKDGKELTAEQKREAARTAVRLVELTNSSALAESAPRYAQRGLGKLIFMYKRYGISMYYMLFKTARDAVANSALSPEAKKVARKQLAGLVGSSAVIAGLQGVPMFGLVALLYDLMFADDDDDDLHTLVRKNLGDLAYQGLPTSMTGADISTRVGLSNLIVRPNRIYEEENMWLRMINDFGGPVAGSITRIGRGLDLMREGDARRGLESMIPAAFSNVSKATRFYGQGAQTLRGDTIVDDIGMTSAFAQAFGFAPVEYTRQLELNARAKELSRVPTELATKLRRQYYMAYRQRDTGEMRRIYQSIMDFNRKYPALAMTHEDIVDSLEDHARTSADMYHGVTIDRRLWNEVMKNLQEYGDPVMFRSLD